MYVILERFTRNVPWRVRETPFDTEDAAVQRARILARYDLTRSDYRVAPLGPEDSWTDPHAAPLTRICDACGMEAPEDSLFRHKAGCPNDTE